MSDTPRTASWFNSLWSHTITMQEFRAAVEGLERENAQLRAQLGANTKLLDEMLEVAENADATGYVTDFGFVDLEKLHADVRTAIDAARKATEEEL